MTISLIVPCYNEETNLNKGALDTIGSFTKDDQRFSEVIIVDDGSTDISKQVIRETYLPKFPKFKLIENDHRGKAQAIITGIHTASSEYVMFSDFDLATPIEEAKKLILEVEKGYEIVIGSRTTERKGAPVLRKILAVGFIFVRNFLISLQGIKDTQCGFKIFKREAATKIIKQLKVFTKKRKIKGASVSAGFDLEFLFVAARLGCQIKEVPVSWRHVESKRVSFFKDAYETFKDILRMKFYELSGAYDFSGKSTSV